MAINAFSLLMALALFTVVSTISGFFLLRTKSQSLWIIALVMILCLLRCAIPIEFKGTMTINVWEVYPDVFAFFRSEPWPGITIANLLCLIWLLVTIFCLCRQCYEIFRQYRYTKYIVANFPGDPRIDEVAIRAADAVGCSRSVSVHIVPDLSSPIMTGFFRPIIALPKCDAERNDSEIEHILRHEIAHYVGGDTWYKLIIQFVICILWCNPAIPLFRKSVHQLFELRCDSLACRSLSAEERGNYTAILVDVAKRPKKPSASSRSIGFIGIHSSQYTKHRIKNLLTPPATRKTPLLTALIACLCIGLYLGSYAFIVQPAAHPPESEGSDLVVSTPENSYLVSLTNNQFEVWIDGKYMGTITAEIAETEPFNQFPIYKKEQ